MPAVQAQKIARALKFPDLGRRGNAICSENTGTDQLCGYRAFVFAKFRFSHDAAQILIVRVTICRY